MRIRDLLPGDELQCWMRLGLALTITQRGDCSCYYSVPIKPRKANQSDVARFVGLVFQNQPDSKVISVHVAPTTPYSPLPYRQESSSLIADISYSAFQRVRKFSHVHVAARTDNESFPANFNVGKYVPFRTLIEITLV